LCRPTPGRWPLLRSGSRSTATDGCTRRKSTAGWLSCLRSLTSNVVLQSHVRALSTSLVAVCDVILDAGTSDFACHLTLDEHDRLAERRPARMGITHRDVLEPDRHATEEDELVRG